MCSVRAYYIKEIYIYIYMVDRYIYIFKSVFGRDATADFDVRPSFLFPLNEKSLYNQSLTQPTATGQPKYSCTTWAERWAKALARRARILALSPIHRPQKPKLLGPFGTWSDSAQRTAGRFAARLDGLSRWGSVKPSKADLSTWAHLSYGREC